MAHEKLDLSLCVPAYNAAWCLPRLLQRAAKQNYPFAEILVYDDCSTDDTAAVAEAWGARVIRGSPNVGNAIGKATLARAATTTWLHFLDADDYHYPNFTTTARDWMIRPDCPDVVLFNFEARDEGTEQLRGARNFDDARLQRDPLAYTLTEQINHFGMYRREPFLAAGGFDEDPEVLPSEDWAVHVRLAGAGLSFRAEPRICAVSSQVPGSFSWGIPARAKCVRARLRIMQKAMSAYPRHQRVIAYELWNIAAHAATYDDWQTAETATRLAVQLGARAPRAGSLTFRAVARIAPFGAMRLREWSVRRFKPHLRVAAHASVGP